MPYDQEIPLLCIYPIEMICLFLPEDMYKNVNKHFIHNCQNLKQPKWPSTVDWINWRIIVYSLNRIQYNKEQQTTVTCNNMNAFHRYYVKWNMLDKKKNKNLTYCVITLTWRSRTELIYGDRTPSCYLWGGR